MSQSFEERVNNYKRKNRGRIYVKRHDFVSIGDLMRNLTNEMGKTIKHEVKNES